MLRTYILVLGALCWTAAGIVAAMHLMSGNVLTPAIMGIAAVAWVTIRRHHYARVPAAG